METTTTTQSRDTGRKEGLMASTTSILSVAAVHADANGSAALCLTEARERLAEGREDLARQWALRSLSHSVGMFHADYQRSAA
jgi:hypothetical protein